MEDRALTDEQREEVMRRILAVWKNRPELRLGQLLENARILTFGSRYPDLFYVEDFAIVRAVEGR